LKNPRNPLAFAGTNDYQPLNKADILGKPIEII
jgi:hypothetical protein